MRRLMKFLHTMGAIGMMGAMACLIVLLFQISIPYVPPLAAAFRATPLFASDWVIVAAIALAPAVLAELIRATTHSEWVA